VRHRFASSAPAFALAALLPACMGSSGSAPASGPPVATVETAAVDRGVVEETVETYGQVEFDPHRTRAVSFVTAGQVLQLLVEPGQTVREGDVLLRLGPVPGGTLEVQQARIDLEFAQRDLERVRRLRQEHLATNDAVQQAEKKVADARAALQSLGVDTPESGGAIRAPFAGVVVSVLVTSGAVVQTGQNAFLLAPREGVVVRAGFETEDAAHLAAGQTVTVEPVFPAEGDVAAHARLASLHRVIDPSTQLLETLIRPASPPPWMVSGVKVRVRVAIRSAADAVRVPRDAVLARSGGPGVFVVEGGTAHWRALAIGIEGHDRFQVLSGLSGNERVVTTGRTSLADGMAVRVSTGAAP
jgi:RND family efflux transporter MFP subunit